MLKTRKSQRKAKQIANVVFFSFVGLVVLATCALSVQLWIVELTNQGVL